MASRQENINAILERLATSLGGDITGAVAVSNDGIVLASRVANEVNAERVGAVAATILGVARRVASEMKIGSSQEMIIKADNGLFMVLPAGDQSLLAVNLRQSANLGLVRIEARDAAAALGQAL